MIDFRPTTTTTPIPTSPTKDVSKNDNEPLSSPYFPDIPDLIAQNAAEDTSKNYDASATDSTATGIKQRSFK